MSRIFEALQKTQGELADFALPVVGEEMPQAASARQAAAETMPPSAQPDAASQEQASGPNLTAARFGHVRTLPVRIRADAPILPFQPGHSHEGEQYRIARTKIIQHPEQPRLIVVSSAGTRPASTVTDSLVVPSTS